MVTLGGHEKNLRDPGLSTRAYSKKYHLMIFNVCKLLGTEIDTM